MAGALKETRLKLHKAPADNRGDVPKASDKGVSRGLGRPAATVVEQELVQVKYCKACVEDIR